MSTPDTSAPLRVGSLFSGYGGLEMGVAAALGDCRTVWVSDLDKGPRKILAHRYPDVPNLGDITLIDWTEVEPIDVLTGGSPCQDLSTAGRRAGMTEGTRSNLWVVMREAIAQLRPRLVVWENVRGAYSAPAASDLEHCPGCMGDALPEPPLRALGRVLGDLADLGYDACWIGLRAADVGAPHARFRVILGAWPKGDTGLLERVGLGDDPRDARARYLDRVKSLTTDPVLLRRVDEQRLLPTPVCDDQKADPRLQSERAYRSLTATINELVLLPTPVVNDMGLGKTPDAWDEWTADMKAKHGNGNGHGASLAIEAQRLLPTPKATNNENRTTEGFKPGVGRQLAEDGITDASNWGPYAAAITRWESVLGRPAPDPTEVNAKTGKPVLSPRFTEWLMGLPEGWITDVPGITRSEALKACGNGVVPQQATEALRRMARALREVTQ